MARGYLKAPPGSPLHSTPTSPELLSEIATQLGRIAHALQKIAYALAIDNQASHWEIRERLGLLYSKEGLQCPLAPQTTKSSAEF